MAMISITNLIKTGKIWPVGIVVGLTAFIAVNLAFLTVAMRNKPQLVSEHYYAEGYNLKQIAAQKAAGEATGWKVAAQILPSDLSEPQVVQFTVAGSGADSLSGTAALYRPSDQSLDIPAQSLRFIGGGRYAVVLPRRLERGSWQAVIHLEHGRQQLDTRISLTMDAQP